MVDMKEIEFRGKRIDTGEWIYGSLLRSNFSTYIVVMVNTLSGNILTSLVYHQVDPNTIGQYVGLDDKNKNRIYEKDIIKKVYDWNKNDPTTFFVELKDIRWDLNNFTDGETKLFSIEVVGNIFENPELI